MAWHYQFLAGDKDVKWGRYLRIKVEIDVNKNGLNFCFVHNSFHRIIYLIMNGGKKSSKC